MKPTSNPNLPLTIENWRGNPISAKGQYQNLDETSVRSFAEVGKWLRAKNPFKKEKKGQVSSLAYVSTLNIADKSLDSIIPIGHAGFVIDAGGVRLVIDPMLFTTPFVKRYTPVPFAASELTGVDYLLLSHNHRDHIDKKTVQAITTLNPGCKILTGLQTGKLLRSWNIKNDIQEAGWFQRYNTVDNVVIDYLPSKHWSRRWLRDTNINLWGSYMIYFPKLNKSIYFGSDSGYGPHFKTIGGLYSIDIALLGIGAFEPQWFMHTGHTGPGDAIKAFRDLKAKALMPMHYGTFDLSDEPVYYPEKVLRALNANEGIDIRWMEVGKRMELFAPAKK